jgi:GNAT superfamily N-acetyltransferase
MSDSQIRIRHAEEGDFPAMARLLGILEPDGRAAPDPEELAVLFRRLMAFRGASVWVAVDGDAVVGTYSLMVFPTLVHGGAGEGIVEAVAVDPACQGKGVGAAMMQHAMGLCRQARCYKLALSSNEARTGAHAFYEAIGFQRHGVSFRVEL